MTDQLFLLKDEFGKLTGIRTPKELRQMCREAVDSISALSLPISTTDSPVVICITLLFTKYEKQATALVPVICDCIVAHCFTNSGLSSITTSLLLKIDSGVDWKTVHSLTEFLQTSVLENFPDVTVIQSYFSIILQLMAHRDQNISSVSYASFQSMLDILVDAITKSEKSVPRDFITICTDIFGMDTKIFEKPLFFILFLIFNDLSCISINQRMRFLTCQKVPVKLIFDVFEMLLTDYNKLFIDCPQLESVFESTVILAIEDSNSLPFIVAFVNAYYSSHQSLCASIFTEFLEKWRLDTFSTLFLFYSVCLSKKNQIPLYVFQNYENEFGATLFSSLFLRLNEIADLKKIPREPFEFSLKGKTFNRASTESTFILTSPFEIVFGVIRSFEAALKVKDQQKEFDSLFKQTSHILKEFYFYALKYSTLTSFDVVTKSFIEFLKESLIKFDTDFDLLINFDVLSDSTNMLISNRELFSIEEKKAKWDRILCKIASYCPSICVDNWSLLFASLFAISEDTVDLSPSFAKNFDDETTQKVLSSLIEIRPFPHLFINDFLISNIDRFGALWPILDQFFDDEIGQNSKIDDKIFELFIDLILKAFVKQTECQLLELGAKILKSTKSVSIEKKKTVLKNLRNVFAENSQELANGYPFLFEILDPEMYDQELLSICFSLFNVICNDYIHTADPIFVRPCLECVFKFSQQTKDINISLSSFDLIWNVVKTMEKNDDNWTHFLFRISDMFYDDRLDVAQGAIRTFFTYLTSNYSSISKNTVEYFLNKGFIDIVNHFDVKNPKAIVIMQQILYEIVHLFVTFWQDLGEKCNLGFYIQKNQDMIMNCKVNDVIVASFQVYDCIYNSVNDLLINNDPVHQMLLKSLTFLADNNFFKVENISAVVVSQFGRTIGNIFKCFKNYVFSNIDNVNETSGNDNLERGIPYKDYLELAKHISLTFKNGTFVHITTQKILDSIASTFPLPEYQALLTIDTLVSIFNKDDQKVEELVCNVLTEVLVVYINYGNGNKCENLEKLIKMKKILILKCKDIFISDFGNKFAEAFLNDKIKWEDEEKDGVTKIITSIEENVPKLAEKAKKKLEEIK